MCRFVVFLDEVGKLGMRPLATREWIKFFFFRFVDDVESAARMHSSPFPVPASTATDQISRDIISSVSSAGRVEHQKSKRSTIGSWLHQRAKAIHSHTPINQVSALRKQFFSLFSSFDIVMAALQRPANHSVRNEMGRDGKRERTRDFEYRIRQTAARV